MNCELMYYYCFTIQIICMLVYMYRVADLNYIYIKL